MGWRITRGGVWTVPLCPWPTAAWDTAGYSTIAREKERNISCSGFLGSPQLWRVTNVALRVIVFGRPFGSRTQVTFEIWHKL